MSSALDNANCGGPGSSGIKGSSTLGGLRTLVLTLFLFGLGLIEGGTVGLAPDVLKPPEG